MGTSNLEGNCLIARLVPFLFQVNWKYLSTYIFVYNMFGVNKQNEYMVSHLQDTYLDWIFPN